VSSHSARKTNDHHSEKRISKTVIYTNSGKYASAKVSRTNGGPLHGSSSCIIKSSFEAVVDISDKEARHEVTLEEDMDTMVEPNLDAGSSSITSAAADRIFQNAKQSYQ
jgi:hypothetical protein